MLLMRALMSFNATINPSNSAFHRLAEANRILNGRWGDIIKSHDDVRANPILMMN
jgi:hypothetical protein